MWFALTHPRLPKIVLEVEEAWMAPSDAAARIFPGGLSLDVERLGARCAACGVGERVHVRLQPARRSIRGATFGSRWAVLHSESDRETSTSCDARFAASVALGDLPGPMWFALTHPRLPKIVLEVEEAWMAPSDAAARIFPGGLSLDVERLGARCAACGVGERVHMRLQPARRSIRGATFGSRWAVLHSESDRETSTSCDARFAASVALGDLPGPMWFALTHPRLPKIVLEVEEAWMAPSDAAARIFPGGLSLDVERLGARCAACGVGERVHMRLQPARRSIRGATFGSRWAVLHSESDRETSTSCDARFAASVALGDLPGPMWFALTHPRLPKIVLEVEEAWMAPSDAAARIFPGGLSLDVERLGARCAACGVGERVHMRLQPARRSIRGATFGSRWAVLHSESDRETTLGDLPGPMWLALTHPRLPKIVLEVEEAWMAPSDAAARIFPGGLSLNVERLGARCAACGVGERVHMRLQPARRSIRGATFGSRWAVLHSESDRETTLGDLPGPMWLALTHPRLPKIVLEVEEAWMAPSDAAARIFPGGLSLDVERLGARCAACGVGERVHMRLQPARRSIRGATFGSRWAVLHSESDRETTLGDLPGPMWFALTHPRLPKIVLEVEEAWMAPSDAAARIFPGGLSLDVERLGARCAACGVGERVHMRLQPARRSIRGATFGSRWAVLHSESDRETSTSCDARFAASVALGDLPGPMWLALTHPRLPKIVLEVEEAWMAPSDAAARIFPGGLSLDVERLGARCAACGVGERVHMRLQPARRSIRGATFGSRWAVLHSESDRETTLGDLPGPMWLALTHPRLPKIVLEVEEAWMAPSDAAARIFPGGLSLDVERLGARCAACGVGERVHMRLQPARRSIRGATFGSRWAVLHSESDRETTLGDLPGPMWLALTHPRLPKIVLEVEEAWMAPSDAAARIFPGGLSLDVERLGARCAACGVGERVHMRLQPARRSIRGATFGSRWAVLHSESDRETTLGDLPGPMWLALTHPRLPKIVLEVEEAWMAPSDAAARIFPGGLSLDVERLGARCAACGVGERVHMRLQPARRSIRGATFGSRWAVLHSESDRETTLGDLPGPMWLALTHPRLPKIVLEVEEAWMAPSDAAARIFPGGLSLDVERLGARCAACGVGERVHMRLQPARRSIRGATFGSRWAVLHSESDRETTLGDLPGPMWLALTHPRLPKIVLEVEEAWMAPSDAAARIFPGGLSLDVERLGARCAACGVGERVHMRLQPARRSIRGATFGSRWAVLHSESDRETTLGDLPGPMWLALTHPRLPKIVLEVEEAWMAPSDAAARIFPGGLSLDVERLGARCAACGVGERVHMRLQPARRSIRGATFGSRWAVLHSESDRETTLGDLPGPMWLALTHPRLPKIVLEVEEAWMAPSDAAARIFPGGLSLDVERLGARCAACGVGERVHMRLQPARRSIRGATFGSRWAVLHSESDRETTLGDLPGPMWLALTHPRLPKIVLEVEEAWMAPSDAAARIFPGGLSLDVERLGARCAACGVGERVHMRLQPARRSIRGATFGSRWAVLHSESDRETTLGDLPGPMWLALTHPRLPKIVLEVEEAWMAPSDAAARIFPGGLSLDVERLGARCAACGVGERVHMRLQPARRSIRGATFGSRWAVLHSESDRETSTSCDARFAASVALGDLPGPMWFALTHPRLPKIVLEVEEAWMAPSDAAARIFPGGLSLDVERLGARCAACGVGERVHMRLQPARRSIRGATFGSRWAVLHSESDRETSTSCDARFAASVALGDLPGPMWFALTHPRLPKIVLEVEEAWMAPSDAAARIFPGGLSLDVERLGARCAACGVGERVHMRLQPARRSIRGATFGSRWAVLHSESDRETTLGDLPGPMWLALTHPRLPKIVLEVEEAWMAPSDAAARIFPGGLSLDVERLGARCAACGVGERVHMRLQPARRSIRGATFGSRWAVLHSESDRETTLGDLPGPMWLALTHPRLPKIVLEVEEAWMAPSDAAARIFPGGLSLDVERLGARCAACGVGERVHMRLQPARRSIRGATFGSRWAVLHSESDRETSTSCDARFAASVALGDLPGPMWFALTHPRLPKIVLEVEEAWMAPSDAAARIFPGGLSLDVERLGARCAACGVGERVHVRLQPARRSIRGATFGSRWAVLHSESDRETSTSCDARFAASVALGDLPGPMWFALTHPRLPKIVLEVEEAWMAPSDAAARIFPGGLSLDVERLGARCAACGVGERVHMRLQPARRSIRGATFGSRWAVLHSESDRETSTSCDARFAASVALGDLPGPMWFALTHPRLPKIVLEVEEAWMAPSDAAARIFPGGLSLDVERLGARCAACGVGERVHMRLQPARRSIRGATFGSRWAVLHSESDRETSTSCDARFAASVALGDLPGPMWFALTHPRLPKIVLEVEEAWMAPSDAAARIFPGGLSLDVERLGARCAACGVGERVHMRLQPARRSIRGATFGSRWAVLHSESDRETSTRLSSSA
ncbi:uncharacterized protein KRP23_6361 [Phytophthora ramorum]|uniref:uncharacterized protein n=1 Tax=Phytophthora ramorum TaxID=164328 RepID=UPI0030B62346|nr:hypothetical protein KRP23_6361 [Phytophthora ramorum]